MRVYVIPVEESSRVSKILRTFLHTTVDISICCDEKKIQLERYFVSWLKARVSAPLAIRDHS